MRRSERILALDPARRYVVPSAPGRRFKEDEKVTDLLYRCHELAARGEDYQETFDKIAARYMDIAEELGLSLDLGAVLDEVDERIGAGASADWCASRGEYLGGMLLADYLGWRFFDPAKGILFDETGRFDAERTQVDAFRGAGGRRAHRGARLLRQQAQRRGAYLQPRRQRCDRRDCGPGRGRGHV